MRMPDGRPRYVVSWLPEDSEEHEMQSAPTLDGARQLAKKHGGSVYERVNFRQELPGVWDCDLKAIEE